MSVNSELSALLTKMGGTPLESDSNSDLIKKISNAYEGGGSGSGILVVGEVDTGEVDADDNPIYQLDKTWKEIYDAPFALIRSEDFITYIKSYINDPEEDRYGITLVPPSEMSYITNSENGYPRSVYDDK